MFCPLIYRILDPQNFGKISVTKLVFGLSIDFQNGMSWSRSTKTQKLVCVLGNGSFPDQGPAWGAHGAGLLNQQYDFFAEETLKISLFHAVNQKLFHFCFQTDTLMYIPWYMHGQDFSLYGNLYLSLHFVPSFAMPLTLFIKDNWSIKVDNNCIWTWAPIGSDCLVNCATTTAH